MKWLKKTIEIKNRLIITIISMLNKRFIKWYKNKLVDYIISTNSIIVIYILFLISLYNLLLYNFLNIILIYFLNSFIAITNEKR